MMQKITNEELGRPTPEAFAAQPKLPLTVVLDNVRSANNTGAFFRTGDAFGIERLVLCGITGTPPSREIHKSALGAELTVAWEYEADSVEAVERLREAGYTSRSRSSTWSRSADRPPDSRWSSATRSTG